MIKAIIIDDNESYRKKLQKAIKSKLSSRVEVIGEAANVKDGKDIISKVNPELIFLDIEMPDGTGFDLLEQLGQVNFDVIFTTSHDQYGIRAIKFSALDYLLKPIDENELAEAIRKHEQKHEEKKQDSSNRQIEELLQKLRSTNNPANQMVFP